MSKNNTKTFPLGRDAKTGAFVSIREAQRRPNTTTIERIPKSGKGDTSKELRSVINKLSRRK